MASGTGSAERRHSSDSLQKGPLHQRPDIQELQYHKIIEDIGQHWYELGIALLRKDQQTKLRSIESDYKKATRCCRELFIYWLDSHSDATWYILAEALKSPGVELNIVAKTVEYLFPAEEPRNEEVIGTVVLSVEPKEEKFEVADKQQCHKLKVADQHQHLKSEVVEDTQETQPIEQSQLVLSKINESVMKHVADSTNETNKRMPFSTNNVVDSESGLFDDGIDSSEDSKKPERICEAVSEFYWGQFKDRWKVRTKSSTINVIAALLIEKRDEKKPKVVVFSTGTTMKKECSYSLNEGNSNEYTWGLCDGHAESICYRLASFYLINEICKHNDNSVNSILENKGGGYSLKNGIKFHFFTTQPPCGFMAKEQRYFLSWKIPFKGKPHCLKCSSTILIGTYLGIQGPLSHLFSKPIYISSIIMPKNKNFAAEKYIPIKESFKKFKAMFGEKLRHTDNTYKLVIPHVEIADVEAEELFPDNFMSYANENYSKFLKEIEERYAEKETKKAAGAVSANSNIASRIMVFSLKDGICDVEDKVREDMALKLKNATSLLFPKEVIKIIKQLNLERLQKAQLRLSKALDIKEAFKRLQELVIDKMSTSFNIPDSQNDDAVSKQIQELEEYKRKLTEIHMQVNNFKKSFCTYMKQFEESDQNIQAVITESLLRDKGKKVRVHSKVMVDNLDMLNDSMSELEIGTNSIVEELVDYHCCKETHDDLHKFLESMTKVSGSCDCVDLFSLELMGCDWARYMKLIHKDIEKD